MKTKLIPALALLTAGSLFGAAGPGLRVTAIRYFSLADVTRVAIEVSGEFQFHSERLHNPERVFFDIFRARPSFDGKRLSSVTVDDKLLGRVRVAETVPGVTRIVLDLTVPVEVSASSLSNPDRLMIELRATAGPAIPLAPAMETQAVPPPAAPERAPVPRAPAAVLVARPPVVAPSVSAAVVPPPPVAEKARAAVAPPPPAAPKIPDPPPSRGARRTSEGGSTMIRALGLKINRVVIDPGHGGHDQGTVGPHGLLEKDLVLDVARRLGKLIQDQSGSEVVYTRSDDTFVPLEGRTAIANERRADLFISIHANNSTLPRIAGVETFYLNFTTATDALDVASRENASSQKSVFELQDLLQKITLQNKLEESRELAVRVQSSLYSFSARYSPGIRNRGVKKAPFVVLIGAQMPSILVEIGFLSNAREETLMKRPDHRQRVAEALFRGVSRYTDGLSHFQMATNAKATL